MNWKAWLHSLVAAAIGGAAAAIGAVLTSPDTFNLSSAGLKHLGVVALFGAAVPVVALLKQSPLPAGTVKMLIIFMFSVGVLFMGAWSCNSTTGLHKAAAAADAIASSLQTAENINEAATTQGLETAAERDAVGTYIAGAAKANDALIASITAAEQTGSTSVPQTVITAFQTLVVQANALNSEGILKLKSAQAQQEFQVVVSAIQTELAVLQALAASGTAAPVATPAPAADLHGPAAPLPLPPPAGMLRAMLRAMPAPVCEPGTPCKLHGRIAAA